MYMQMGGNAGDGATLGAPDRRRAGRQGLRRRPQGAVLGLGARDHDQPVQGGGRRQADLHRDHGPSRQHRLPRPRQGRRRPGHHRDRRQLADDRPAEASSAPRAWAMPASTSMPAARSPPTPCSRKGLKSGDEAMVYGVFSQAERGQSEKGPRRHAREGRAQGRPLGDHPGGQQRRLARRARARRLHPEPSRPEGDRHPAWRHHRRAGRGSRRRPARSRARSSSAASTSAPATIDGLKIGLCHRDARSAPLSAGLHAGAAVRADGEVQDAGPDRSTPAPASSRRRPSMP